MAPKRKLPPSSGGSSPNGPTPHAAAKRPRCALPRDAISTLSDELLIRIFSFLGSTTLLAISPVSRRFRRIAADSQLWRAHYYTRFVLPRALRIPGFKVVGSGGARGAGGRRLHYSARRAVWADGGWGRRGGLVDVRREEDDDDGKPSERVDWKSQYKLRHNWARGKCAVEEVSVRDAVGESGGQRTLVKVVEGIAVTADSAPGSGSGLRAWDLRTRRPIAQISLQDGSQDGSQEESQPTCLAVDEGSRGDGKMDIIVGFQDGSFGVWTLDSTKQVLTRSYRHEKSTNGELVAVAYGYPYTLTATSAGLISLYTFRRPATTPEREEGQQEEEDDDDTVDSGHSEASTCTLPAEEDDNKKLAPTDDTSLPSPYLLTSLKSHSSRPPLALSIRSMAASVSASIAYTFDSLDGWCIGIQDINITPSASGPDTLSSRLAYTLPMKTGGPTPQASPSRHPRPRPPHDSPTAPPTIAATTTPPSSTLYSNGPTTLCYSHPYLLATLPDNTLILHLCTSSATSLTLSPGIRLWGHTSGISDAEITPRGKAVSVSARGDEIRVWELEGRVGGSSIEVRPRQQGDDADAATAGGNFNSYGGNERPEWEDRRNWVGFDDEMVIVLKEARDGRESLMVYDFT